jgi:biopolymer transport protein ExbD
MGASLGTNDKKSLNVELNIVPFIDLMSCLTAFLLVTAVWVNIARIQTQPVGHSRDGEPGDDPPPQLSVLVEADQLWIGVSRVNEFTKIPKTQAGYDWTAFETALRAQKASSFFSDTKAIQVAAESTAGSPVTYHDLVAAMDIAVKSGFVDVGITDPNGLAARPGL